MKTIVPVGIGLILSIVLAFFQYRNKSVSRWMMQRRLEAWHEEKRRCPTCGKIMIPTITKAERKKVWCCSAWQTCKTYLEHHTGQRLSAAEVERTEGKRAL